MSVGPFMGRGLPSRLNEIVFGDTSEPQRLNPL